MSNIITISVIWAASDPEAPYIVDAWDEYSIEENPQGWDEAVAKAYTDNPDSEIRIVEFNTNHDAIVRLFKPTNIPATRVIVEVPQDSLEVQHAADPFSALED